jgi:hypothetical protein
MSHREQEPVQDGARGACKQNSIFQISTLDGSESSSFRSGHFFKSRDWACSRKDMDLVHKTILSFDNGRAMPVRLTLTEHNTKRS